MTSKRTNPEWAKTSGTALSRRSLLKKGLLGGALLLGSGIGLAKWPSRRTASPRRALRVFDETQFSVLAAVAARTVTAPGADPVAIAHSVDEGFALQPAEVQRDFKQLLTLFENALAGVLLDHRLRPFTRLDSEGQDATLRAWRDSRIALRRGGYLALRSLTTSAHYACSSTWAALGYPGPPAVPA
jgi:hypothetical protein